MEKEINQELCRLDLAGRLDNDYFAVLPENMAVPAASFLCPHCAQEWGRRNLSVAFRVEPKTTNSINS